MFLGWKTWVESQPMEHNRTSTKSVPFFVAPVLELEFGQDLGQVSMASLEVQFLEGPVQGFGGIVAFYGGWLVEPEVVLAKPEWFKRLTRLARGLLKSLQLYSCLIWDYQKSSQLCFCLIWRGPRPPPEPPALQSRSAGAGG